jgi:hypothetical protein
MLVVVFHRSSAAARIFASSRRLSLAARCPWLGTELVCVVILLVFVRVGTRRLICRVFCRRIIPFGIRLSGRRSQLSPAYNFPVDVLILIVIIGLDLYLFFALTHAVLALSHVCLFPGNHLCYQVLLVSWFCLACPWALSRGHSRTPFPHGRPLRRWFVVCKGDFYFSRYVVPTVCCSCYTFLNPKNYPNLEVVSWSIVICSTNLTIYLN